MTFKYRGFKPGQDYLARYRFKPCAPLLSYIYDRISEFDAYHFDLFNRKLQVIINIEYFKLWQIAVEKLTEAGILVPGHKIKRRGFWLFPIIVPNKVLFAEYLNARGVHAFRGATQLCYVKPLPGYKDCEYSKWFMDNVIYLPLHSSVPD